MTDRLSLSSARPAAPWSRPRLALVDCAALVGLAVLALALRVPSLLTVPRFTAEQLDVLYTLPLTGTRRYRWSGSIHTTVRSSAT